MARRQRDDARRHPALGLRYGPFSEPHPSAATVFRYEFDARPLIKEIFGP
jgi:hypothetical protein